MAGVCKACRITITVTQKRIKCAHCARLYHSDCIGFSNESSRSQWKCPLCKANFKKGGDNSNTPVRAKYKATTCKNSEIVTRPDPPPPAPIQPSLLAPPVAALSPVSASTTVTAPVPIDNTNLLYQIDTMLDTKLSLLKSQIISDLKNSLVAEFRKELAAVTTKYDLLEESHLKIVNDYESLKKDFVTLQNKMLQDEDNIQELQIQFSKQQQRARLSNIEIVGLPETTNESPIQLVVKIASHVGVQIQPEQILSAHRVQPMRKINGRPKPIVATLETRILKDKIISGVRRMRGISTSDLNIGGSDRRFFVNEHLTPENKQLLNAVKSLAKEKSYKFTWVRNCTIFLRKNEESPVLTITSEKDFRKIN